MEDTGPSSQDPWKPLVFAGKLILLLTLLSLTRVAVEVFHTRDLGTPVAYLTYLGVEVTLYGAAFAAGLGMASRRSWAVSASAVVGAGLIVDAAASLIVNGENVLKIALLSGSGDLPHTTAFASRLVMTAVHLAFWPWVLSLLHRFVGAVDRRPLWTKALLSAGLLGAVELSLYLTFGF